MSLWSGLKNIMNVSDDDYEDEYEEEKDESAKEETTSGLYREPSYDPTYGQNDYASQSAYSSGKREATFASRREKEEKSRGVERKSKTVPFNPKDGMQLVLAKPERFDDVSGIADDFCAGKTVVLNLEKADKALSRRIIDFMSGVVYSRNGKLSKAANFTFVMAPADVNVSGDHFYEDYEESGNLY